LMKMEYNRTDNILASQRRGSAGRALKLTADR